MTKHKNKKATRAFHRALHRWYRAHGRLALPWRVTRDPYAIYISEIMLQQTQVKTVLERYYFPFLRRFPTLKTLAKAKRRDVLKAWQGLGYYNRAVNLHEAARQCGGILPKTPEQLEKLPGIGRNTAHAVAAFAYRRPVPVMEANVRRVLCRILALKNPSENALWEKAAALLDTQNAFEYNQAMMDLGALVCTARSPNCQACPASGICEGKIAPASYPAVKKRETVPIRKKQIVLLRNTRGEYFAEPRKGKFLNGMYRFVEITPPPAGGRPGGGHYRKDIPTNAPLLTPPLRGEEYLGHIRQQYSHFTLEAEVYLKNARGGGKYWYHPKRLQALPLSGAEQKILALIAQAERRAMEVKK